MRPLTRRQFLGAAAGFALAASVPAPTARAVTINPRSAWATNRPPKGPLSAEDVRYLIVHHSASRTGHTGDEAPGILRGYYDYHTSPEKGWNDIAYNFLIDAEGGIWEGRAGSLDGPVAGDATGGNQGFSQLVCLIGDYNAVAPPSASLSALVSVLVWLADRYDVSTAPGSEVTFTSRGSNKHPSGTSVTTPTITGHRTMSQTKCPGDILNAYVVGGLMADVTAARVGGAPAPTTTSTTAPTTTTTVPPMTTTMPPSTTTIPPTTTTLPLTTTTLPPTTVTTMPVPSAPLAVEADANSGLGSLGRLATTGALVATGAGLLVWRYRRINGADTND